MNFSILSLFHFFKNLKLNLNYNIDMYNMLLLVYEKKNLKVNYHILFLFVDHLSWSFTYNT